jgi:hypothetical protein
MLEFYYPLSDSTYIHNFHHLEMILYPKLGFNLLALLGKFKNITAEASRLNNRIISK